MAYIFAYVIFLLYLCTRKGLTPSLSLTDVKQEDIVKFAFAIYLVIQDVRSFENTTLVNQQVPTLRGRCLFVVWAFLTALDQIRDVHFFC